MVVRKMFLTCIVVLVFISYTSKAYAVERVVLEYIPSEIWYETVYLMADRKGDWDYDNFVVQLGNKGRDLYHFPHWYHGKYDPALYKADLDGNSLKDIVVVLNNEKASGPNIPIKDVHVLNVYKYAPDLEEVKVEPLTEAVHRLAKMKKQGDLVTITTDNKEYKVDTSIFQYKDAKDPYLNVSAVEYTVAQGPYVGQGILMASIGVSLSGPIYGAIGSFEVKYRYNGEKYLADSIEFEQSKPPEPPNRQ
jgi:hypothetical protein